MITTLHAEAGLSECVRYDVCDPGFEIWMGMWLAGLVLVPLWLSVVLAATVDILTAPLGSRRTAGWLAVVWLLPIVGVIVWFTSIAKKSSRPEGSYKASSSD